MRSVKNISIELFLNILLLVVSSTMLNATTTNNLKKVHLFKKTDTLKLSPNESFFAPVGTLKAHLLDKKSGNPYNKNEYYDYIYNWKRLGDTILFAVNIKKTGSIIVKPEMRIPLDQNGAEIFVYFENEKKELVLETSGENYKIQKGVTFNVKKTGVTWIKLQLKSLPNKEQSVGQLKNVYLLGNAVEDAAIEMRRYRPFAVHTSWRTDSSEHVEISVHELTVMNTSVNCYQPITAPFGYTGSPWSLKSQTFGGYNFSLWSYGAKDIPPPFYQESHLIAVGPNLTFGSYGHEGTGVKPRGDHPYEGIKTNKQIIAVRKVPGKKYDTYWSYYLDPLTEHWKLYGCGKKFNKKGTIEYLKTGAFVEVAGAASRERSGHIIRETQYSGWQRSVSGDWYPINKMIGTSKINDISSRDWSIEGNKFSLKMGGFGEVGTTAKTLSLSNPEPLPNYLKGEFIDELYAMPAVFEDKPSSNISTNSAVINFEVLDLGTNASAEIFWDTEEGLTKEVKWKFTKKISVTNNKNQVILNELKPDTSYFYRIKITNDQGIVWSFNTQMFKTSKNN